jgi:hypothetical protein
MLAHFEDLNFSFLEFDIRDTHFLLAHDLDSHMLASLLMNSRLDQSELALPQGLFDVIEVEQIRVSNHLLYCSHPLVLFLQTRQVVGSGLVRREYQLEGEQLLILKHLLRLVLQKYSDQVVHAFMLFLIFVLVDIKLLPKKTIPILLQLGLRGLSEHFSFYLLGIPIIVDAEVIQHWRLT